jgi:diacylglycerol kinase (ATP)
MTTLVVLNPAAGGGRGERALPAVLAAARKAWGDVELVRTVRPGNAVNFGKTAAEEGLERIVVVGGDGTIHETANGLLCTGIDALPQLAMVPIGTGNDFARLTGTHRLSPGDAVRRLASGVDKLFDVGLAWGEYFVNSLGLGFDAAVAARVPRFRRLWRPLVYPAAVFQAYRRYRPFAISLEGDDATFSGGIFCIEIGIGKSAGGGFYLTPDALPDDGLLDACIVRPLTLGTFLTRMPAAHWGGHTKFKEVQMMQSTSFNLRADTPLTVHFDGEIRSGPETIEVSLVPNRLPVLAARHG